MNLQKVVMVIVISLLPILSYAKPYTVHYDKKDMPNYAVTMAEAYDYVREKTNKNDGPQIELWQKNVSINKGDPWCAAFVYSMYLEASEQFYIEDAVLPYKSGRVAYQYAFAKKNKFQYKIITPKQIILGIEILKPGDIAIWSRKSSGTIDFTGHEGIVLEKIDIKSFWTIEGNAQPTDSGDQGEGGGVYKKLRLLTTTDWTFKLEGFIRIKQE